MLTDMGESSEHPAHPTAPGQRGTQQAQSPRLSKCASNDRAAHQASSPASAILIPCQPSRERPTERQPRTPDCQRRRLRHLKLQQRPYIIPRNTGKSPQYSLRDPPSPPDMAKN
ncbi:Vacuolar ATP synthase proteolipid subunit [Giardia duodenalis assemblage B]|uniref:Vacuolar ATP synthase proteolipid subunit n=1 Tax=Giardia duodenalis assemblage B TaxID=1394984 RepID=A0A132NXK5_GIAIN|nr:Vacuolar ATP synthase proteolipid subunit [Giardia intestinalis assemblage B]